MEWSVQPVGLALFISKTVMTEDSFAKLAVAKSAMVY